MVLGVSASPVGPRGKAPGDRGRGLGQDSKLFVLSRNFLPHTLYSRIMGHIGWKLLQDKQTSTTGDLQAGGLGAGGRRRVCRALLLAAQGLPGCVCRCGWWGPCGEWGRLGTYHRR